MKKIITFGLLVLLSALSLSAQEVEEEKEVIESKRYIMQLKGLDDINPQMSITMNSEQEAPDAAYFGLYLEDLTFPKAQELKYEGTIGVLVTGVVQDSPAWHHRLREDDIITQINGQDVTNFAGFEKIRKSLRAGDQISVAYFRAGKPESMDMTLGSRIKEVSEVTSPNLPGKKKISVGYGGGTWIPMWVDLEMDDINKIVAHDSLGFNKFRDDGLLQQGLGGKFSIGKGYFLGGQITWFEDTKKTQNKRDGMSDYQIYMRYENMLGGVTLDKRFPIVKNLIGSVGLMVGGSYHEMEFINTDANYDWADLPDTITDSNNTHFLLRKGYLNVQPRAEIMYRVLSWMGLRAEVGYTYGYSLTKDWRVRGLAGESFEVSGSPDTPFQGMTVTIGPWFGF
ncbi:MAG: PDZ domain-containing protein [Candidatus Cloacimonetes bacterium]|jgi:hypothetical protein|nr:PDZ domain-containing protein [Candidatus Cloacimonadota bacterium]MDY0299098.1 PDZ domain-containing protein [Candidatus Cloacimonadaceae bacterium]MCB5278136.1 PDZ domain-containing protein [Candidatus Cloacimonadota bacterium]MCK9331929.1 PDZ domain-containing protein [Candidatus Cloacimonadota bacterium]MDD2210232.1 PDZ domain-containing protein [Candidatus Cloacimonadota bacterium]